MECPILKNYVQNINTGYYSKTTDKQVPYTIYLFSDTFSDTFVNNNGSVGCNGYTHTDRKHNSNYSKQCVGNIFTYLYIHKCCYKDR